MNDCIRFLTSAEVSPAKTLACVLTFVAAASMAFPAQAQNERGKTTVDYTVRVNDTLYDLSAYYLTDTGSWTILKKLNRVSDPRHLQPNSTLHIPLALLKQSLLAARAIAVSGSVERTLGKGPFVPLNFDAALTEGDHVRTGANSFATIQLSDGSHVTLHANTTILIKHLRATVLNGIVDRQFELNQGEVETKVTPLKPQDRYNIIAPSVIAGVRGTEFRVAYGDDAGAGSSKVEVLEGKVAAQGPTAPPVLVPQQFGVVSDSAGNVSAPIQLLPAPSLAVPGRVQDSLQIAFEIAAMPEAHAYRATIATDAGFLHIVNESRVENPRAIFDDMPARSYFVRLSAIDSNGIEGLSQIYSFRRARLAEAGAAAARSVDFEFRWTEDARAAAGAQQTYHFVLASDSQLHEPVLDQTALAGTRLVLSDLKPGKYFWSVAAALTPNSNESREKPVSIRSFTVGQ